MRIIRHLSAPAPPLVLAIGNFDGVHIGHRHLIEQVRTAAAADLPAAAATAVKSAVMTFEPHPLAVLRPQQPIARISSLADKLRALHALDIDLLYLMAFTSRLAAMPAEAFADLLFRRLATRHLFVGGNFRFGNGARGDTELLKKTAAATGAQVTAVPLLTRGEAAVSSGRIRRYLQEGDFTAAADLLGQPWRLRGNIIRGEARGRSWGYPTANLALTFNPPLRGIFAARANISGDEATYAAAVSIGSNPTVSDNGRVRVEAHLLDFAGDIYGKKMTLQLLHKLRDEKKYTSTAALAAAIGDDVAHTRRLTE